MKICVKYICNRDSQDNKDHQDLEEDLDYLEQGDNQEIEDLPDPQDKEAPLEILENRAQWVCQGLMVIKELEDPQENGDRLEYLVRVEHEENQADRGLLDHPDPEGNPVE